jgi:hypothetical protein
MKNNVLLLLLLLSIGCSKEKDKDSLETDPYYLSAIIDKTFWKVEGFGTVSYVAPYDYNNNRYEIIIVAGKLSTAYDKIISFHFNFLPPLGKYFFNNEGVECSDSCITAGYVYWDANHNDHVKYSDEGYIEITSISCRSLSGFFSFTAKGYGSDSDTSYINEGRFNAAYGGGNLYLPCPK